MENTLRKILDNSQIDMIIMRRVADTTSLAFIRQDIVTSGQRILKRDDLEKIFQDSSSKYQLEVSINTYMMKNKKIVYWMPLSIHNIWKQNKWGLSGYRIWLRSTMAIFHAGLHNIIWQTLFFCRQEAP